MPPDEKPCQQSRIRQQIQENILAIKKKELAPLYEEIKAADCVICGGSGRSLYSLNAAMSQIALATAGWRNKVVLTPDDPGFPGKSMYDAAPDLERRYKKTLLLMNSGSGYSEDPLVMAQDLAKYIEEKEIKPFLHGFTYICNGFATCRNHSSTWTTSFNSKAEANQNPASNTPKQA